MQNRAFSLTKLKWNRRLVFPMKMANDLGHIIYLRDGPLILSKVHYTHWREIQDDFESYMTSLGPWSAEDIVSFLENEYEDESDWPFSRQQIFDFMDSDDHLLFDAALMLTDLRSNSATALQFNEYINNQDLEGLTALMTDDYTFIDSSDEVHHGKALMTKGWGDFFTSYPDYRNFFELLEVRNGLVLIAGYSICSYEPLDGPALWTAKVSEGLLSEWRIYLDTPENRSLLGFP